MTLADFIGKHEGETCWIFGKGPSLDAFPMESAGSLRFAINDVCAAVKGCAYVFANDGVQKWRNHLTENQTLFQPSRALREFDSQRHGSIKSELVIYDDESKDGITTDLDELSKCLRIRRGTVCSALQVAFLMGVTTVVMVGFDGTGGHSKAAEWSNRIRTTSSMEYTAIRDDAVKLANELGIAIQFFNTNQTIMENGKIRIKITRNCFANGQPMTVGETVDMIPKTARELIACHSAVLSTEPPVIETAESPLQARESAVIKTAKAKR